MGYVVMNVKGHEVKGIDVDPKTKCKHYHSEIDIIAIKFKCCNTYYPCYECHEALTDHTALQWGKEEHDEKAILCGNCGKELTINEYLQCNAICPHCSANFNAGCSLHHHFYFE